jgi:REP element-mobilizing transposase RayT
MKFSSHHYYHLYNRTINQELLFKEKENYIYFLRNFRSRFDQLLSIHAWCLMPTHFHFLICVKTKNTDHLPNLIGTHLSAYTKAVNKRYERHGSLFQRPTKAIHVDDPNYLITLLTYIHQNPVRANLVANLEDWPFSSYLDLAGFRNGTLADKSIVDAHFHSKKEFINFSNRTIDSVKNKDWI